MLNLDNIHRPAGRTNHWLYIKTPANHIRQIRPSLRRVLPHLIRIDWRL